MIKQYKRIIKITTRTKGVVRGVCSGLPLLVYLGNQGEIRYLADDWEQWLYQTPIKWQDQFIIAIPSGGPLSLVDMYGFIDGVKQEYKTTKTIGIGHSFGARNLWSLAIEFPQLFHSVAAFAGYGNYIGAERIKDLRALIFHCKWDSVVPYEEAIKMYNTLINSVLVHSNGHEADISYWLKQDKFYEWLLQ